MPAGVVYLANSGMERPVTKWTYGAGVVVDNERQQQWAHGEHEQSTGFPKVEDLEL